jgi:hypothetical protein
MVSRLYGNTEADTIILSPTSLSGHTRVLAGNGDDTILLDQLPTITTTHLRNYTDPASAFGIRSIWTASPVTTPTPSTLPAAPPTTASTSSTPALTTRMS